MRVLMLSNVSVQPAHLQNLNRFAQTPTFGDGDGDGEQGARGAMAGACGAVARERLADAGVCPTRWLPSAPTELLGASAVDAGDAQHRASADAVAGAGRP